MKVLIVDDSLLAGAALKTYFDRLNHEVVAISKNGEDAIKKFEQYKPELVTVDAVMPGMSGQEFIRYLNTKEKDMGIRTNIFMISSDKISTEDRQKMRVDKYLLKPITMNKIEKSILEL